MNKKFYKFFLFLFLFAFLSIRYTYVLSLPISFPTHNIYILNSTGSPISMKLSNIKGYNTQTGYPPNCPQGTIIDVCGKDIGGEYYTIIPPNKTGEIHGQKSAPISDPWSGDIDYFIGDSGPNGSKGNLTQKIQNDTAYGYSNTPAEKDVTEYFVTSGVIVAKGDDSLTIGKLIEKGLNISGNLGNILVKVIDKAINYWLRDLPGGGFSFPSDSSIVAIDLNNLPAPDPMPVGNYNQIEGCSDLDWYKIGKTNYVLSGTCKNLQGIESPSTLNYSELCGSGGAGVVIVNGQLECEPPADTCNRIFSDLKSNLSNKKLVTVKNGDVREMITLNNISYENNLCFSTGSGGDNRGYIMDHVICSWSPKDGWNNSSDCNKVNSNNCYNEEIAARIKFNGNIPVNQGDFTSIKMMSTATIINDKCWANGSGATKKGVNYNDVKCDWLPGDDKNMYPAWGSSMSCSSVLYNCQQDLDDIHSRKINNVLLGVQLTVNNNQCKAIGSGISKQGKPVDNDLCTWIAGSWKSTLKCLY